MKYRVLIVLVLVLNLFSFVGVRAAIIPSIIYGMDQEEPFHLKFSESNEELEDPHVREQVGIYVLSKNGELKKIVSGQILPHSIQGSVLARFATKNYDDRHAMLAILDNKLKIFSTSTTLDDERSVIEIGSKRAKLYDSATNAIIKLPQITEAEKVQIALGASNESGQAFLISVKLPASSVVGSGVTFAGFLRTGKGKSDTRLALGKRLYVVDYRFHDRNALQSFFSTDHVDQEDDLDQSVRVITPLFAKSLGVNRETDSKSLKEWRKNLKNSLKEYYKFLLTEGQSLSSHGLRASLPWIDLRNGVRGIPSGPDAEFSAGSVKLMQIYDLLSGGHQIHVRAKGLRSLNIPGSINLLNKGQADEQPAVFPSRGDHSSVMFYIEDTPYLLFEDAQNRKPAVLQLPANEDRDVPHKLNLVVTGDDQNTYAFVSEYFGNGSKGTKVYIIASGREVEHPHLKRVLNINSEFYSDGVELRVRIVSQNEKQSLFFDDLIPNRDSVNVYNKDVQQFAGGRRLEINSSTNSEHVYLYPRVDVERFRLEWINGSLSIVDSKNRDLRVELGSSDYDQVSFSVKRISPDLNESDHLLSKRKEAPRQYLVFFSAKEKDNVESTVVFQMTESKGRLILESSVPLCERFYHQKEFLRRISLADDGRYLFDDVTPPQSTIEEYVQRYEHSGVHIDVLASKKGKIVRRLTRPIKEVDILSRFTFKIYGYNGQVTEPSGLYERKKDEALISGQLLTKWNATLNAARYFQERVQLQVPRPLDPLAQETQSESLIAVSAAVMLVDPSFQSGEHSLSAYALIASEKSQSYSKLEAQLQMPISSLDGIHLIAGEKENAHRFFLVYSVKSDAAHPGGVYALPFEVTPTYEKKPGDQESSLHLALSQKEQLILSKEWLTMSEVKARIVIEKSSGEPCFELSIDHPTADPEYEVLSLASGKKWKPNISNNPAVKIERSRGGEGYRRGQGWRIFGRNTVHPLVTEIVAGDPTEYRQDALPDLTTLMSSIVEPGAPVSHTILLVNKTLKPYVMKLLMARYIDDVEKANPARWNYTNHAAPLYLLNLNGLKEQSGVLENLNSIREMRGRPMLLADLQDVVKAGEPTASNEGFQIKEYNSIPDAQSQENENGQVSVQIKLRTPSLFYLLATEGEAIDVRKFLKRGAGHWKVSQVLVATREELEEAKSKTFEQRYGVLDSYKIVDLGDATPEVRKSILRQGLEDPAILALDLKYDASGTVRNVQGLTNEEQRDLILDRIVRRAEAYAVKDGQDVFNALLRTKVQLMRSLLEDEWIRKNRVVDLKYISRVFSQVFSVQLVLKNLPDDDLLQKVARPNAVVEWQKKGYAGDFTFKRKILQTILGQLTPDDSVKVPASFLIIGPSRAGKTHLWETLVHMLDLKKYDFFKSVEENEGAQAIKIGLAQEASLSREGSLDMKSEKEAYQSPSIEQQLQHLQHLLTTKNGPRAFILFDDVHLLPPKERKIVTDWIRKHLEQKYYVSKSPFTHKPIYRPTLNLAIFMTLNPPEDISRIRDFDPTWNPYSGKVPDPGVMLRAALHDKDCPIEESFMNRFKEVLWVNRFSAGAKGPALIKSTSELARNILENSGHLFLLSPNVVSQLVNTFPEENAKNFISNTSSALLQVANRQSTAVNASGANILIFQSKDAVGSEGSRESFGGLSRMAQRVILENKPVETSKAKVNIEDYVEKYVVPVPLNEGYTGKLELLRLMLDSFRVHLFEEFVQELTQSEKYAMDSGVASFLLAPSLYGLGRHVLDHPVLSLKELGRLDPYVFGARTNGDRSQFVREFKRAVGSEPESFFPEGFDSMPRVAGLISVLEGKTASEESYPVQDILRAVTKDVYKQIVPLFEKTLEIESTQPFPDARAWLSRLRATQENPYQEFAKPLTLIFDHFREALLNPRLYRGVAQEHIPDFYDLARVFGYVIDRAISQLPWGEATNFMVQAFDVLKDDMNLVEMRGVQDLLFTRSISLLRPTTKDLVLEAVLSSPVVQEIGEKNEEKKKTKISSSLPRNLEGEIKR